MKFFKIFVCVAALSTIGMLAGCTKDKFKSMNSLRISFEKFNGGDKASIGETSGGFFAFWEDGDQIRLTKYSTNDTSYDGSVSVTYPNQAAVAEVSANEPVQFRTVVGDVVYAGYPLGRFSGLKLGTYNDISLPSSYNYVLTNSKQKVECPMIGKVTISETVDDNVLSLYNLCCMLRIRLDAPSDGSAFVLDGIVVKNTTTSGAVPLSGGANVNFSGSTPSMTMGSWDSSKDRITISFPSRVPINQTKYFYVPIPPLPSGQTLEIAIHDYVENKYSKIEVQTTDNVPANSIVTIMGPSTDALTTPTYVFKDYIVNNNNTSKIDLGVYPTNTMKMEITFAVPSGYMSGSQYYTGSRPGDANTQIYFGLSASSGDNKFRAHFCSYPQNNETGSNYVLSNMSREENVKYIQTLEVKPSATEGNYYAKVTFQRYNADGTITTETHNTGEKVGGVSGAPSICVFSLGQVYQNKMKLYSYRIWNGNTLLHNFVPAIKQKDGSGHLLAPENQIHGVYDMVDGSFKTGTGSFTCAND